MKNLARLLVSLGVMLLAVTAAWAATQNAVVYGTVYDASGQPMPGVTVLLQNSALGFSRTTTTGSDGSYNFAEIPPADDYRLTASKAGRALDIRGGVSVNVGDERVILPPLTEQVVATDAPVEVRTVSARDVGIETASTSISGVITGDQLRSLPLYNRNFLALGLLTPNVRDTEPGSDLAGASFSIAGTRPSTNNFLLDGADNVASSSNQAVPFQVNEAIQEFRVTSSTASAEYGRNQGGVVSVVTRRGGNAIHGSAFGYFANDTFNADSPLSVYNGTTFDRAAAYAGSTSAPSLTILPLAPINYNEYVATAEANGFFTDGLGPGGTPANTRFDPAAVLTANDSRSRPFSAQQFGANLGGALITDKLFGFVSYEGTRIDNPNLVFERVPSAFDRTFDPLGTGYTFASGLGASDPNFVFAQDVLALFPAPTVVGVPGVLEFFRGEAPNYTNVHNFLLRADYAQSDSDAWSVRYAAQKLDQLHDATLPTTGSYPGNGAFRDAFNQNLNISYSRTFSPTVINEIRMGFSRFNLEEKAQDRIFDATAIGDPGFNLPSAALPTILLSGIDAQSSGAVPGTNGAISGWSEFGLPVLMRPTLDYQFPFARLGAPLSAPSDRRDTTLFIADNLSVSHGKHGLKMGGEFRHLRNNILLGAFSRGLIFSSNIGQFTSDSETCNETCATVFGASQAFLRPSFDFAQAQSTPYDGRFRSHAVSAYLQDTWRFHPRWTLNFGARYEYFSPPKERGDRIWNFDPEASGLVQQGRSGPVLDPYGNTCGSALPTYESVPDANSPAFGVLPGPWLCGSSGSGEVINSDRNNLAARGGIVWDMWGNGKTVLRYGIGFYYDHLPTSFVSSLLFNRPTSKVSNPNALFGTISFDLNIPGLCPTLRTCAVGSSIINPAVQAAVTLDGINPNSVYGVASQPFAIYARDVAHSNTPYTRQMSASVQQSITDKLALEVGYVGTSGKQLPVVFNSNYQNEFTLFEFNTVTFTPNQTAGNLVFFPIYTMTNQAESSFHSLMVRARAADWHGLRVNAAYSLSNVEDNASSGFFPTVPSTLNNFGVGYQRALTFNAAILCLIGTVPGACLTNPLVFPGIDFSTAAVTTTGAGQVLVSRYNTPQNPFSFLQDERGRSDFHTKHRFVLDYTWDVPLWKESKWMGNWQISGIFVAQSGQPFTIFAGPILGEITQRANLLGPVSVTDDPNAAIDLSNLGLPLQDCITTIAALPGIVSPLLPALGTACTGDSVRNAFTGPNFINFDFAVQKGFPIGEGRMLSFRGEFYNLFNRENFYNPISALSTDGANINPDFGKIKSAHAPRQIQFAVRFTW